MEFAYKAIRYETDNAWIEIRTTRHGVTAHCRTLDGKLYHNSAFLKAESVVDQLARIVRVCGLTKEDTDELASVCRAQISGL